MAGHVGLLVVVLGALATAGVVGDGWVQRGSNEDRRCATSLGNVVWPDSKGGLPGGDLGTLGLCGHGILCARMSLANPYDGRDGCDKESPHLMHP